TSRGRRRSGASSIERYLGITVASPVVERKGSNLRGGGGPPVVLDDDERAGREERGKRGERRLGRARGAGRGDEDEVERAAQAGEGLGEIASDDLHLAGEAEVARVGGDAADGFGGVVDEGGARGAARERLEPERSRAGIEIENADGPER